MTLTAPTAATPVTTVPAQRSAPAADALLTPWSGVRLPLPSRAEVGVPPLAAVDWSRRPR